MYIKRIRIHGFKTYRSETIIDNFTPHCNLVLGKNGSGKSNLLDAVNFVLSDKYASLSSERRLLLLHEGVGERVSQADVEIVFDNSDKRIPWENKKGKTPADPSEVCIRRTIGQKKDQWLINDEPISEVDFQNLLESAGLSRSNPYYIVEQGKITTLMTQKPSQRLELFKEIAGTRTYDDRKRESLKIMKETDSKAAQIDTVIGVLNARLKELDEEAEEFKKFQTLDNTRRCLEYSIYEQERESANSKLEAIEKKRASGSGHAEEQISSYAQAQAQVKKSEEELEQLQVNIKKAQARKKGLTDQESSLLKRRTELELGVKDLQDRISGASGNKDEAAKELKQLQKKIKDAKEDLIRLTATYDAISADEEKLEIDYQRSDQRVADLAGKRDRSAKYSSKKDRDADLKKQVDKVTKQRNEFAKQIEKVQAQIDDTQASADKLAKDMDKKESQVNSNRDQAETINKRLKDLTEKRDAAITARKAAWKREADISSEHGEMKSRMDKAQRSLQMTMDKDLYRGVDAVKTIVQELKIDGVHGPLIELFSCSVEFHQCVEITAGNSLFHVVVDNEQVASRIVKELIARKMGRVTFIPLNRINPVRPDYPSTNDAMPMIHELKFEPKFEKAMLQVFGKTLIARDLALGASLAAAHNLNTITLAGDRVDKKGALTGGFNDLSEKGRSRLAAQADIAENANRWRQLQDELAAVQADLRQFDVDVNKVQQDLTKANEQKNTLRSQTTQLTQEISQAKKEHKALTDTKHRNEGLLPPLRASLAAAETQLESFETEQKSEFKSGLTGAEEEELKRVSAENQKLKTSLLQLRSKKADAEAAKVKVESLLNANLNRREEELNVRLNAVTQEDDVEVLQRDEAELIQLSAQGKELEGEIKGLDKEIQQGAERIRSLQNELDKLRATASDAHAAMNEEAKSMDKLLSQRSMLLQKREDAMKKIRELGALPKDAFEKYKDESTKSLFDKLEKTQKSLKKFSGVNRKALEQYQSFTEQRTDLLERKKELDSGRESILELIKHLDSKKDEAIERTFKTIAKHFSEVFAELVPGGKATLVMETRGLDGEDEEEEDEDEKEERKESSRPSKKKKKTTHDTSIPTTAYTGIGIKVSFTGVSSHSHQLSGGQNSVVALSLIFAIQRCDPSPFYLLDEIDSALDPVHRTAVTNMLKEQSKDTQFIFTTFHSEMLPAGEKFFGVVFKNKTSTVRVINKDEALKLIQASEKEAMQQE